MQEGWKQNILKGDSDFILIIFMGFLLAVLPTSLNNIADSAQPPGVDIDSV